MIYDEVGIEGKIHPDILLALIMSSQFFMHLVIYFYFCVYLALVFPITSQRKEVNYHSVSDSKPCEINTLMVPEVVQKVAAFKALSVSKFVFKAAITDNLSK